jgi:integrase/recombinase XerD
VQGLAVAPASVEHLLAAFLASQDVKPGSKAVYERQLRPFFRWAARERGRKWDRDTILAYKAQLFARGLSPWTVSSYLVLVRKFFEWAEAAKLYPNIAKGVKGARRPRGFNKDILSAPEVLKVLKRINRKTLLGKRDFAALNLMVRTGLRTVELSRADVGDVRSQGGKRVLWVRGKGRDQKDEFVLLTEDTWGPLRGYLVERQVLARSDAPLFASESDRNHGDRLTTRTFSQAMKAHFRRAGLVSARLTAHSLRHTAITLALEAGASLQEAQAMARHANITTTMVYAQNMNRIRDAAEPKLERYLRRKGRR